MRPNRSRAPTLSRTADAGTLIQMMTHKGVLLCAGACAVAGGLGIIVALRALYRVHEALWSGGWIVALSLVVVGMASIGAALWRRERAVISTLAIAVVCSIVAVVLWYVAIVYGVRPPLPSYPPY